MAEAFMLFVGTAIGAGAVVPAVITIIRREYRGMACLAFVLALTPAFVWDFMMDWVIARQGLVLKP